MTRSVLTSKAVEAATSKGKPQLDYSDSGCTGLVLRVTLAGKKTWSVWYTDPKDQKSRVRFRLGEHSPIFGLKEARTKAAETKQLVSEQNIDPRDLAAAMTAPKTMAELIEDRLSMEVRGKMRSAAEIERRFNKYVIPIVGRVAVKDFQIDPHLNAIIDPLVKRDAVRQAGTVFQDLTALFTFAIQRGAVEFSRMARAKRPDKYVPRERFLSCDEIKIVWEALPVAIPGSVSVQRILKLCLATGQRLSEVAGMTRDEINLGKSVWTIPRARVKNGDKFGDHVVPLSDLAMSLVREAMRDTNGDWLFPNTAGTGALLHEVIDSTLRRSQQARDGSPLGKFGIPAWRPHDLRRTVATQMSRKENALSIPHLHISHVLNHRTATNATITSAVYDKNDFLDEKREALDKWGAFLARLVDEELQEMGRAA